MTNFTVPFVSLRTNDLVLKARLVAAFTQVLEDGQYILGPQVETFEARFAALVGARFGVGMADGTAALYHVLRALGVGAGDEVITAPNSFIASAAVIALLGARPVFADVRDDLNIDPAAVAAAITSRTRAVMPVHLTGRPAAMREIGALAVRHELAIVEDAAQAVGASLDGKPVGSFGIGCFSLHPLKNLAAAGDAGVVTTDDGTLAATLRALRNHGLRDRDHCDTFSFNDRLDTVQAAVLNVKLDYLAGWTAAKRRLAARYTDALRGVVRVPEDAPGEVAVYQTYVIRADRRDDLQRHLLARGIDTKVHYPVPIHLQVPAQALGYRKGDFPVTERLVTEILSLPLYPELTDDQQDTVVRAIRDFYTG